MQHDFYGCCTCVDIKHVTQMTDRTENLQNKKKALRRAKFAVKFLLTARGINIEHEDVN